MNVRVLIDAVVRQNMVLVATLSTAAGVRAPLAHVANEVFLNLVQELEAQGLRQKVIADMFGLALRSYQRKVQRLTESATEQGRSLWEAVFSYVHERETVSRADVLRRFRFDDEAMVRGVLDDLVESGLVYRKGRLDATVYRAADDVDNGEPDEPGERAEADAALVWVAVYRSGGTTRAELGEQLRLTDMALDRALERLVRDGRIARDGQGADARLHTEACFTPYDEASGWEAALFDHYQAVVTAIVRKLRAGSNRAKRDDRVGGSTYSFDVWRGHPFKERVYGLLRRVREEADLLLDEVVRYNETHGRPADATRVSFYAGQSLDAGFDQEGVP